jgi:PIN domain nuclease of toxin-antitoxin system
MNLLIDTNILLAITKDKAEIKVLNLINPQDKIIFVSIVSLAENPINCLSE